MNKKATLPPEGVEGIETIEDILALTETEKRELLRWWKERQQTAQKCGCAPRMCAKNQRAERRN